MATVTIGKVLYTIPELNFIAVERCWPYVSQSILNVDPISAVSAGVRIIAAGLMESESFEATAFGILRPQSLDEKGLHDRVTDYLKRKLLASEIHSITSCVISILEEAGLMEGEELKVVPPAPAGMETPNPSPETAAGSSPSSSPRGAREGAGTV